MTRDVVPSAAVKQLAFSSAHRRGVFDVWGAATRGMNHMYVLHPIDDEPNRTLSERRRSSASYAGALLQAAHYFKSEEVLGRLAGRLAGLKIQECSGHMRCFLGPSCCDENSRLLGRDNDDSTLIDVR